MLLLVDAGNTRIKWAAAQPGAAAGDWVTSGALAHDELPALTAQWQALPLTSVLAANVAGAAVAAKIESALAAASPAAPAIRWFRSQPACAGVTNGYRNPGQLGCDRFASLIGARHRYPGRALLIVTAGTATTVDALDATGRFVGGMILPGLRTMAQSLAVNTALLPAVEDARTERLFADNTQDAIVSGCIHAQVGAILQAHAQWPAALCVLSGGGAPYIGPQLPFACERIDNLVVLGLHVAALTEAK
jgi:type III pantothenate kinase